MRGGSGPKRLASRKNGIGSRIASGENTPRSRIVPRRIPRAAVANAPTVDAQFVAGQHENRMRSPFLVPTAEASMPKLGGILPDGLSHRSLSAANVSKNVNAALAASVSPLIT